MSESPEIFTDANINISEFADKAKKLAKRRISYLSNEPSDPGHESDEEKSFRNYLMPAKNYRKSVEIKNDKLS